MSMIKSFNKHAEWFELKREKQAETLKDSFYELVNNKRNNKPVLWNGYAVNWDKMTDENKRDFITTFWHWAYRSRSDVAELLGISISKLDNFKKKKKIIPEWANVLAMKKFLQDQGAKDLVNGMDRFIEQEGIEPSRDLISVW